MTARQLEGRRVAIAATDPAALLGAEITERDVNRAVNQVPPPESAKLDAARGLRNAVLVGAFVWSSGFFVGLWIAGVVG